MILEIPSVTPLGKSVNTIGIWMSGGADSSLLCYLLAEKIKKEKLSIKILPITIDYKRPFAKIAVNVREKIEELLNAKDIFLKHIVYHPASNENWTHDELSRQFHLRNQENIVNNRFQILYSGITTNPPKEIQEKFHWGILEDVERKRGNTVDKETVRYFVRDEYEFFEIKPFFNMTKQDIARLYQDKKLLDNIFPLTRSCEKIGTVTGHCGKCWWCEERKWAFEKL
jgi:7-cyano-7-deazaguanine synthase in queuosine biosynthesis